MAKKRISGSKLPSLGLETVARALVKAEGGKLSDTATMSDAKARLSKAELQGGKEDEALPVEGTQ